MLSLFQNYRCYVTAALCSFTLSGCALFQADNVYSNPADYTATRITYLTENIASQLQDVRSGQILQLGQSPWGSNSTLEISERYFSAAGKPCVSGRVITETQKEAVVICQYQQQRWGATRALTRLAVQ